MDPVFIENFDVLFIMDIFALILSFKKYFIKILFILITELFCAPLNFAPSLSSPWSQPCNIYSSLEVLTLLSLVITL